MNSVALEVYKEISPNFGHKHSPGLKDKWILVKVIVTSCGLHSSASNTLKPGERNSLHKLGINVLFGSGRS